MDSTAGLIASISTRLNTVARANKPYLNGCARFRDRRLPKHQSLHSNYNATVKFLNN